MTRKEIENKISELQKMLEDKVGYKDDEIFLLSIEEYERYKGNIPNIKNWGWLRSPGVNSNHAAFVYSGGSVHYRGDYVSIDDSCVRPALHLESSNHKIGERIVKYNFPFIVIDDDLAIAEVPIGFEKFDDESNDYCSSYIRKWLLDWKSNR